MTKIICAIRYYPLLGDIVSSHAHTLIAGQSGSGKSVLLNNIIPSLLASGGNAPVFYFIDLKRVELYDYKNLSITQGYCDEPDGVIPLLEKVLRLIERRYNVMQANRQRKYEGVDVFLVIDEYADLMLIKDISRDAERLIARISMIGRAAGVHLILGTQRPTHDVIGGAITANFDVKFALKTANKQDSRNIIGTPDAYDLPRIGEFIMSADGHQKRYSFGVYPNEDMQKIIEYYSKD